MGRSAIVLAAGFGSRMKSKTHKVLHPVCGRPMILHILDELDKLNLDQVIVVVGQQREKVEAAVAGRAETAFQEEQLGTGDAVKAALPLLRKDIDTTVVLYGDAPLIRATTLDTLMSMREENAAAAVVLTADVANPKGLGRVFINDVGQVDKIVEEKDATPEQKSNRLINTGIYAYRTEALTSSISELKADNAQNEYYLTDTLSILRETGNSVTSLQIDDVEEIASVNDRVQLAQVEKIYRRRIAEYWMREGVSIEDLDTTFIGSNVKIGRDATILAGTRLEGTTEIMEDCTIGPDTRIVDSIVHEGATIQHAVVLSSRVESGASVGPYAYLRPGSHIGKNVKIGDFVEIKNSTIGDDSKVSHLAYVGDATIGERVNVGCGVITVNYDGKEKHRTVVGSDSFVGSNVNLIAPVEIGTGAYLCAGSTITDNVPNDSFAIGRERQVTKENYVQTWKSKRNQSKEAPKHGD